MYNNSELRKNNKILKNENYYLNDKIKKQALSKRTNYELLYNAQLKEYNELKTVYKILSNNFKTFLDELEAEAIPENK